MTSKTTSVDEVSTLNARGGTTFEVRFQFHFSRNLGIQVDAIGERERTHTRTPGFFPISDDTSTGSVFANGPLRSDARSYHTVFRRRRRDLQSPRDHLRRYQQLSVHDDGDRLRHRRRLRLRWSLARPARVGLRGALPLLQVSPTSRTPGTVTSSRDTWASGSSALTSTSASGLSRAEEQDAGGGLPLASLLRSRCDQAPVLWPSRYLTSP